MTATADESTTLDPKVGDALLDDQDVMAIMQHPKLKDAIEKLKVDPSCYHSLVAEDLELQALFTALNKKMSAQEEAKAASDAQAAKRKITMDSPAVMAGADVPPLEDGAKLECEGARAKGTAAFEAGDYAAAAAHYERTTVLEPHHAPHWTNLSVARLRGGEAKAAVDAAREATRRNPRFAKAWLRLGEALTEVGEATEAVEIFESGLKRSEGAIRIAMTRGLQKAQQAAPSKPKLFTGSSKAEHLAAANGKAGATKMADATPAASQSDGTPTTAEEAMARVHGAAAAKTETPAEPPKRLPKALPTWEEEKALAAETEALRKKTEDQMKKYAEMAKQQTTSAATRPVATRPAAAPPSAAVLPTAPPPPAAAPAASTACAPEATSVPMRRVPIDDEDDEDDAGELVPVPAPPSAQAKPTAMRKILIDDDEEEEEAVVAEPVLGPDLPPTMMPTDDANATQAGSENSEQALGAALAQWSLNKQRSPTKPKEAEAKAAAKADAKAELTTKPAPTPVLPGAPGLSLSNGLIFDLA